MIMQNHLPHPIPYPRMQSKRYSHQCNSKRIDKRIETMQPQTDKRATHEQNQIHKQTHATLFSPKQNITQPKQIKRVYTRMSPS